VKAALLDTGDPVAGLSATTVTGRRLNLDAALRSPTVRADTTTAIGSHYPDPSTIDQAITVRYSVAVHAPGGSAPTGNVTVRDGTDSCTGTVAAGRCTLALSTAGPRALTATYSGDAYHNPSTSSAGVAHEVTRFDAPAAGPDPAAAAMRLRVPGISVFGVAGSPARCGMRTGSIRSCTVRLLAGGRVLARGRSTSVAEGSRRLTVALEPTRFGRTLLSRRLGGVRARVRARAATSGGARRAAGRTRAVLRVERLTTPAGAWAVDRPAQATLGALMAGP
jgi:hypothetical protein